MTNACGYDKFITLKKTVHFKHITNTLIETTALKQCKEKNSTLLKRSWHI